MLLLLSRDGLEFRRLDDKKTKSSGRAGKFRHVPDSTPQTLHTWPEDGGNKGRGNKKEKGKRKGKGGREMSR